MLGITACVRSSKALLYPLRQNYRQFSKWGWLLNLALKSSHEQPLITTTWLQWEIKACDKPLRHGGCLLLHYNLVPKHSQRWNWSGWEEALPPSLQPPSLLSWHEQSKTRASAEPLRGLWVWTSPRIFFSLLPFKVTQLGLCEGTKALRKGWSDIVPKLGRRSSLYLPLVQRILVTCRA